MKVLHICCGFPPDPIGGTEVYVESLCRALSAEGIESIVAAPARASSSYVHEGVVVRRFATSSGALDLREMYASGDPHAASSFAEVLDEVRPDVVHQHALTPACSVRLAQLARAREVPVVFTYHTPTTSCPRGTLVERGETPCDGRLDARRCTACTLEAHGVPMAAGRVVARTPATVGEWIRRTDRRGRAWTALQMPALLHHRIDAFRALVGAVDCFVALAPWVERLLRANGVSPDRIVASAHGIETDGALAPRPRAPRGGRLRLVHLGRLAPEKGTALLLRALRALPDAPIDLDIFGIVQSDDASAIRAIADGDSRVRWHPAIAHAAVIRTMQAYDAVVVPSQTVETGPLVVIEAGAAGVPVLGSALGGIADHVVDGETGLLVADFASVGAWTHTLRSCIDTPSALDRLHPNRHSLRTMAAVADDMDRLYRHVTSAHVGVATS